MAREKRPFIRVNKKHTLIYRPIMENYLGRKLKSWEVVHHKDGNPMNNDVSNLEVMSHKEHAVLHRRLSNGESVNEVNLCKPSKLTFTILGFLNKGMYPAQIARKLEVSRAAISKHMKILKKHHYIKENYRTSYGIYELTERGRTAMELHNVNQVREGVNLASPENTPISSGIRAHNIRVVMPILKDAEVPWEKKNCHNFTPQMKDVPILGCHVTKTVKSIIVNIKPREFKRPDEIMGYIMAEIGLVTRWLKRSYGIEVDFARIRISNQHYAIQNPIAGEFVNRGLFPSTYLGREAEKILPADPVKDAWAWVDASKGPPEFEWNDVEGAGRFLEMPEKMDYMFRCMRYMAENEVSHVDLIKSIRNLLDTLNVTYSRSRMHPMVRRIRPGQTIVGEYL